MKNILVFAGTYSQTLTLGTGEVVHGRGKGIYVLRLNHETGALTRLGALEGEPNPTYLAMDPSKRFLYACNELKTYAGLETGAVSAYGVNGETGALTLLNRRITGGTDACHVAVNRDNTHVLVANFMSGSVCMLPIQGDGSLGKPSCFLQHKGSSVDPGRQQGPHAHACVLDPANRRVLVPDLGTDEIVRYEVDWEKGHLIPDGAPNPRTRPGQGPRHAVFHPSGRHVYVINEMGSTIDAFTYGGGGDGPMERVQTVSTLPAGFVGESACSAIKLHPSGMLLYGANRGHDSVAAYRLGQDGRLDLLGIYPTLGQTPRDFDIDPTGTFLIAGNQASGSLVVFRIHMADGSLEKVHEEKEIHTVTCVLIAQMAQ